MRMKRCGVVVNFCSVGTLPSRLNAEIITQAAKRREKEDFGLWRREEFSISARQYG
jgi:hypothetical protein